MSKGKIIAISVISVLLAVVVAVGALTALTYYNVVDIPVISDVLKNMGIEVKNDLESKDPAKAGKAELKAILDNSYKAYLVNKDGEVIDNLQGGEFQQKVGEAIKFSILECTTKDDVSTLKVKFKYPNIVETGMKYKEKGKIEKFKKDITKNIKRHAVMSEKELELQMIKKDNLWYLVLDEEFSDVLTGGLKSFMQEYNRKQLEYWEAQGK